MLSSETQSGTRARPAVRLGILGTGLAIEKLHWPALRRMPDRFEVAAFADESRPHAAEFSAYSGASMADYHANYADLLTRDDVEAVLIALPIPLLYAATRAALAAGKHVICEKPAGVDAEQASAFLKLADEFPHRKVLIAENFFYRDDLRLARSLLDEGAIGQPHLMSWRMVMETVPREGSFTSTPWRWVPAYRGGPQLDGGVHWIAQMRLLCGDAYAVHGSIQEANPKMGGASHMTLNLRFVSGAIGSFSAGNLPVPTFDEPNEMRLYGSQGVLAVGANRTLRLQRAEGRLESYAFETDNGYYNQLLNFYDAIVFDEPIVGTIEQSVKNVLVVMRALDSAETERQETIPGELTRSSVPLWRARGQAGLFDGQPYTLTSLP